MGRRRSRGRLPLDVALDRAAEANRAAAQALKAWRLPEHPAPGTHLARRLRRYAATATELARLATLAADRTGRPTCTAELTPRQGEVATLVAAGCSNRQIAARLHISQRTAESHVEAIMLKLGVSSRTQIAVWLMSEAVAAS